MKRVNLQEAFIGEPDPAIEGLEAQESDQALILAVRGGELTIVVPPDVPEEQAVERAKLIRGTLALENERVLTFEVHTDCVGVLLEDEPAALHRRRARSAASDLFAPAVTVQHAGNVTVARDLMTTDVLTVPPDLPVQELAQRLVYHRVSGMPVVDAEGRLIGIVSEGDVIAKQGRSVAEIMTREVVTVEGDTPAAEIAALMAARNIKRVPVMEGSRLIGIVSRADIVAWVARGSR
jgi:CBS domain-containing protein